MISFTKEELELIKNQMIDLYKEIDYGTICYGSDNEMYKSLANSIINKIVNTK